MVSKNCRDSGFLIPKLVVKNKNNDKDDQNKSKKIKLYKNFDTEDENEENAGYEGATVFPPEKVFIMTLPIPILDYASLYPRSMIYI